MFAPKQLLVNCATLLCLEHKKGVATSPSTELVQHILEAIPVPETTVDHDHGRQTFLELRKAVQWLNGRSDDDFPSETEVKQQIEVSAREETYLYSAFQNAIDGQFDSVKDIVKLIQSYRSNLQQYLNEQMITKALDDVHRKIKFKPNEVNDLADTINEFVEEINPLVRARQNYTHPSMVADADFSELGAMENHFENVKERVSTEGGFQTGWKGLNRMLGKAGVFKRGEFWVIGGLEHNFKSGFMLSMFIHFILFNKPFLKDPSRKPLLVFISLENELDENLLWIYKYLKENDTGEPVIDSEIDKKEASHYVVERLRETGFEVRMQRYDPSEMTVGSLLSILDGFVADGYEIQALLLDYLNMVPKTGIPSSVAGDDIRLLYRRVRNYCSSRSILCITPHQLSSDAKQLQRDNIEDFVKVVAGKGYYDGCRRLGQDPDGEIAIGLVRINEKTYLTMHRGKHRGVVTPPKDLYVVLPFAEVGTIPWDIDKEHEITLAEPGGGALGSGQEMPWWKDDGSKPKVEDAVI